MSTITVVRKNNEIAIAADTLAKWGSEKNSAKYVVNNSKILKVGENYIAITGPSSGHHILTHYFNKQKGPIHLRNIDEIYSQWLNLHSAFKEHYHLDVKDDSETAFEASGLDILIANPHGIFAVGSHRDVQEFKYFYSYGAGNEYALGAMYVAYDNTALNAEDVARLGVEAAAEFDDSTGQPIDSFVVSEREHP